MKTLIAFYSRADENYFGGAMRYVKVGNTEIVSGILKELTGADTFKIEMAEPYSPVYMTCIDQAKKDLREQARPELKKYLDSIDAYDTIILGYPNWWGLPPMAVFTFLESYDFSGKKIVPFCSHEGSGLGGSIRQIKMAVPDADLTTGVAIHGAAASHCDREVKLILEQAE